MRAVRLHGIGRLTVEDIAAPPDPGAGEVKLRVLAAGICGSDLHNYRHGLWLSRVPVTPGHEFTGDIVAVGAGVTGLHVGDRVVADSRAPCGACEACAAGTLNHCRSLGFVGEIRDGGFAEETLLPAAGVLRVDKSIPPEVAALAEPLAVALHGVNRLAPVKGEPIFVAGGGPIGGLTCLVLDHLGFGPVLFAEQQELRRKLVADATRARAVELDADDIAAAAGRKPIRFAVEATGAGPVLDKLISLCGPGARVAMVGLFHGKAEINATAVVEREIDLRGCSVYADEQKAAVSLLPQLAPRLRPLVGAPITLDEVPAAYHALIEGRAPALKTVICPNAR